jgi:hypothetical protein
MASTCRAEPFPRQVIAKGNRLKTNRRVPCSPVGQRPAARQLDLLLDLIQRQIPERRFRSAAGGELKFCERSRMDFERFTGHLMMPEICWRASAQATGLTLPESNS